MKKKKLFQFTALALAAGLLMAACQQEDANIKMYSHVWDEIINKGRLELFDDSDFAKDVLMHTSPADVAGADNARACYAHYLTGFSHINFTIKNIFVQADKLVKQRNFKGKYTGVFSGIPATGKEISLDAETIVRMVGGKIAGERDFFDNMDFMTQLGLVPSQQ